MNFSNILNEQILMYVFIAIVIITIGFLVYTTYDNFIINRKIKNRKIIPRKIHDPNKNVKKNTWMNYFISKLDKDNVEMKLIHAGMPMGIKDVSSYIIVKFLFTLGGAILGLELYDGKNVTQSMIILIVASIFGFFMLDVLISQAKKGRIEKINSQLPMFLVYFDTYNKAGFVFGDILSTILDVLNGELKKEAIRFNVSYSMTKDFEGSLKDFVHRLGTPDADSLEIKLRQCYYSGVYDDVLSDEKEMIDKKILNDMAKQTKKFELYLALGMGLLLLNMFLILIYPLGNMINSGMTGLM